MIKQLSGVPFLSNSQQSSGRPRIQYNYLGMWFYYRSSMFNEEGKLIVIHEYQPPEFSPFLNPICKNTYNALPKIYGHTRKRKYLLFPLTTKHSQDNRCLRDCCEHRYEYERSRTDVKQLKAKMKVDPLLSQHTVSEEKKKERATKLFIAKQKKKTPVLKQFNSE